uniref:Uncharacterized protein n=1 Tax=Angiostrongylus cantonensis TaxID=6313 RepID=A0A0K0D0K5_ANGCA
MSFESDHRGSEERGDAETVGRKKFCENLGRQFARTQIIGHISYEDDISAKMINNFLKAVHGVFWSSSAFLRLNPEELPTYDVVMNSLVAKSYSSGGLSFINEESLCDDRRQSVDEGLESSSNPKCHTSNVFPDQNNCLIVEGVATVRHMRTAPLMSTSDCSDMSDVSDIDCRAHRGHSSSEFAPKGILRPRRLMTVPKQLSFDIPPSPVPSAKSSCVSQTGSYHMFERPARALRVRREPDRFRLALLQQRSNSESVFGITPPQERSRRLSVAHIPSRDQALLRKILGPQGLSWISTDKGEAASKKSISIGYSNDLEAHKMDDDSELPLMDGNQETISPSEIPFTCITCSPVDRRVTRAGASKPSIFPCHVQE